MQVSLELSQHQTSSKFRPLTFSEKKIPRLPPPARFLAGADPRIRRPREADGSALRAPAPPKERQGLAPAALGAEAAQGGTQRRVVHQFAYAPGRAQALAFTIPLPKLPCFRFEPSRRRTFFGPFLVEGNQRCPHLPGKMLG